MNSSTDQRATPTFTPSRTHPPQTQMALRGPSYQGAICKPVDPGLASTGPEESLYCACPVPIQTPTHPRARPNVMLTIPYHTIRTTHHAEQTSQNRSRNTTPRAARSSPPSSSPPPPTRSRTRSARSCPKTPIMQGSTSSSSRLPSLLPRLLRPHPLPLPHPITPLF